jgi:3',5'-cyclic-AMP phosphodiesterase
MLGAEQLSWLEEDLRNRSASQPVVVFAHIPLWTVYPEWGWGTEDSARALALLKRFGSVTVLNGHIHQVMQKMEGKVTFHTAMSTAFPQPVPGTAPSAGPLQVPGDELRRVLGITDVNFATGRHHLAVVDATLAGAPADEATEILRNAAAAHSASAKQPGTTSQSAKTTAVEVSIGNFAFAPQELRIKSGTTVHWTNRDDVPHSVEQDEHRFSSPILDTNGSFQHTFEAPGKFPYFCKLHPHMTGAVIVD